MSKKVEKFPKSIYSKKDVEDEAQMRLDAGAKSSIITEDDSNWILTTEVDPV